MPLKPALRGALIVVASVSVSAVLLPASPASAVSQKFPVSAVISVATTGNTGDGGSLGSSPSSKGRFVAFTSSAGNLVAGDTNGVKDVFVRDTLAGTTQLVSVSTAGARGNGDSDQPSISFDGRYVAFRSAAANLVAGDTNAKNDVFLRDLRNSTTIRVSVKHNGGGQTTGGDASYPNVSDDGTMVSFLSSSPNVVDFDLNNLPDVFVRDVVGSGTTDIATVTSSEVQLALGANAPAMSGNGRFVVFDSDTAQVGVDTNGTRDVFLRDRTLGTTERVSIASNGDPSDGASYYSRVSDNGRYVAFQSIATDLTPAVDAPGFDDVFRRDRTLATTELVSRTDADQPGNKGGTGPSISADGTKVAFASQSTNLITSDTNAVTDAFVRDLSAQTTTRSSVKTNGGQLDGLSYGPELSPEGGAASFTTLSTQGFNQDVNATLDVYLRGVQEVGPFGATNALVQQAAHDFTGAYLDGATLGGLDAKIQYGLASPASTLNAYAHGSFAKDRAPVMRLYWAFFKRVPDAGGLNYWSGRHANGMSMKAIANGFAKSSEFKTNFGAGTDTQFITLVYTNVLERQPDQAGLTHWINKMKTGTTRGEMMINFSESPEGIRRMRGEIDTELVILGMLHRVPTKSEVTSYANALELNGGQVTEVLIDAILTGPEYASLIN
ncbi:MAG: domain protein beta Propeller [Ilumatobacteraceae bacterium]|nr:domain protein beta Propeller [Ilumatobacteraceae bacterium]